jgi:hypothetical protein
VGLKDLAGGRRLLCSTTQVRAGRMSAMLPQPEKIAAKCILQGLKWVLRWAHVLN